MAEEKDIANPYEDDSYFTPRSSPPSQQQYGAQPQPQYPGSPLGRASPWGTPGGADWRTPGGAFSGPVPTIDDVARALSTMELNNANQLYSNSQSPHSPRSIPIQPPLLTDSIRQNAVHPGNGTPRRLQLNTDLEGRKTPTGHSVRISIATRPSQDVMYHSVDLHPMALRPLQLLGRNVSPNALPTQVSITATTKVKKAPSPMSLPFLHSSSTR